MSALFADRIHTAKQLNRTSGKILAEAREHAVTVVTEGEDAVVIQNRTDAARQAQAESWLKRLAPLMAYFFESDLRLPHELRWVKDLHPKNLETFRHDLPLEIMRATRSGDFDAFEDWLYDWQVASEVDANRVLRRRLKVHG